MVLDIDQYILFTIYPTLAIFGLGLFARKAKMGESWKYVFQASTSIVFSIIYFEAVPDGGAQGLAVVLFLFGILLFFMARKYMIHPEPKGHDERTATSANES
ncbi:MAG TPA: hypothetical protein VFI73_14560 [Candidatus Nitrosopolaris sp.]|nr:hypothetical protein [Candidatus Nitrosopolaris sp.]